MHKIDSSASRFKSDGEAKLQCEKTGIKLYLQIICPAILMLNDAKLQNLQKWEIINLGYKALKVKSLNHVLGESLDVK